MENLFKIQLSGIKPRLPHIDKVVLAFVTILAALAVYDLPTAKGSVVSTLDNLLHIAPFLIASIVMTAYAAASDLDNLVARVFTGKTIYMVALAAVAGAFSPFCSCGVIPLIAALLAMHVPLAAVMAFWLSSPIMDPSMFILTAGAVSLDFALFKTAAALLTGMLGGLTVMTLSHGPLLADPLRPGVGNGGCAAGQARERRPVYWTFWREPTRITTFSHTFVKTAGFLFKWLALAYLLESILLTFVPAELVIGLIGGNGLQSIGLAVAVGVPAYLNGFAALPLVAGLMEQGMNPGAAMAFLLAGGVTSIPAALAVFALVKLRVFLIYISVSLASAFTLGLLYSAIVGGTPI